MEEFIVTILFTALFMLIAEKYGPVALYEVANRYLKEICINEPFISIDNVPSLAKLHLKFQQIQEECVNLVANHLEAIPPFQKIDPTQEKVTQDDDWRVYILIANGRAIAPNVLRCVETTKSLHEVDGWWNAFFSYLGPGKHIPPHTSLTKGLLRYNHCITEPVEPTEEMKEMLDLKDDDNLSEREFFMVLNNQKHIFKTNEGIFYDSTFPTGFINHSEGWVSILTIDVLRPLVGFAEGINRLALGMVAKHKDITSGIRRAVVRISADVPIDEFRGNVIEEVAKPMFFN